MTAREHWKRYYRVLRIARRETLKAASDMLVYGTGVVIISSTDHLPRHIPMKDIAEKYLGDLLK